MDKITGEPTIKKVYVKMGSAEKEKLLKKREALGCGNDMEGKFYVEVCKDRSKKNCELCEYFLCRASMRSGTERM